MSYGEFPRAAWTTALVQPSDPVRAIMASPVATVDVAVSVREAAEELAADEIGAVLVTGDGALGVLSERDVIAIVGAGGDPAIVQAGDVLNSDLVWVGPDESISTAGRLMLDCGVRHLPVGDGRSAVGIISIRDVLRVLVDASAVR